MMAGGTENGIGGNGLTSESWTKCTTEWRHDGHVIVKDASGGGLKSAFHFCRRNDPISSHDEEDVSSHEDASCSSIVLEG